VAPPATSSSPGCRLRVRLLDRGQRRVDVPGASEHAELAREPSVLRAGVDRVVSRHVVDVSTPYHARGRLFHHLVRRRDAPQIGSRRVLGPHFRFLRMVAVPGPPLEIAELLVYLI